jgi:hypothetical protein
MIRVLSLCAGLCGAACLSQYPEFAQQYTQRLAGQVDALGQVVADFDRSALDAGLTRPQALEQLAGTEFLNARQADMRETFSRHDNLSASLAALRGATAMTRIKMFHRLNDTEILQNTWTDFKPAVPVTAAGAVTAAAGFFGGWASITLLLSLLARPFKRRPKTPRTPPARRDPPIQRAQPNGFQTPRLMGETRP